MKIRKPTDKEHVWIGNLVDRSTSSVSLLMILDGKKIALSLTRPIGDEPLDQDALLDKATALLIERTTESRGRQC